MRRLWLGLLLFIGLGPAEAAEELQLTVLFTSDVHARLLPFDEVQQRPTRGSLAQVASLVEQVRRENPLTVVLDGGDAIQGTPMAHYVLSGQMGNGQDPTVTAMNLVGYDAAVLGNHEFNYGLEPLRRALRQSRFPWLAANMEGAEKVQLPVRASLILQRGPLRVGVVGLTNPRVPYWDPPEHWQPLVFSSPVEAAQRVIQRLRAQVDVLIVVAHTGFERDLSSGRPNDSEEENFAWRLAQLKGVDPLLTGHPHRNIPPKEVGNTWVAQPGRWAELVTRFDLILVKEGGRYRITRRWGTNVPVDTLPPSPRVEEALRPLAEQVRAELGRPLAELLQPLTVGGLSAADDAGVDLIHRVQLWASGAQLSLAAPTAGLPTQFAAGPVTPRMAHALYVFPNSLAVVRLSGAQLRAVVEHAVRGWTGVRCQSGSLELLRDPELPTYNYDTVEGARYVVDPTAPLGERVRWLEVAGKPVEPEDSFTLVVNSYRAAGGGGYPFLRDAPRVKVLNRQVVDLLVEYFSTLGRVAPAATNNWFFAPRLVLPPVERR
ncbi:MAG: bifunctional metallophosphatase/5'-nucleotidase [Thermoanaerobaculum sp.]|nr:bifunctional metallophosphatase/5'-nucleotidase [Thermoanaerobaculum sp.]